MRYVKSLFTNIQNNSMLKISLLLKKFTRLHGQITQELLGLGKRNSQGIDFVGTQTYREIFKSALVCL